MTKDEALTLALEILKAAYVPADLDEQREKAITELEALAQPERTWVGLTDEERNSVLDSVPPDNLGGEYYNKEITAIAIAIEAKLKEKNA